MGCRIHPHLWCLWVLPTLKGICDGKCGKGTSKKEYWDLENITFLLPRLKIHRTVDFCYYFYLPIIWWQLWGKRDLGRHSEVLSPSRCASGVDTPFFNVSSFPPPPLVLSELLSQQHTGVGDPWVWKRIWAPFQPVWFKPALRI